MFLNEFSNCKAVRFLNEFYECLKYSLRGDHIRKFENSVIFRKKLLKKTGKKIENFQEKKQKITKKSKIRDFPNNWSKKTQILFRKIQNNFILNKIRKLIYPSL